MPKLNQSETINNSNWNIFSDWEFILQKHPNDETRVLIIFKFDSIQDSLDPLVVKIVFTRQQYEQLCPLLNQKQTKSGQIKKELYIMGLIKEL